MEHRPEQDRLLALSRLGRSSRRSLPPESPSAACSRYSSRASARTREKCHEKTGSQWSKRTPSTGQTGFCEGSSNGHSLVFSSISSSHMMGDSCSCAWVSRSFHRPSKRFLWDVWKEQILIVDRLITTKLLAPVSSLREGGEETRLFGDS